MFIQTLIASSSFRRPTPPPGESRLPKWSLMGVFNFFSTLLLLLSPGQIHTRAPSFLAVHAAACGHDVMTRLDDRQTRQPREAKFVGSAACSLKCSFSLQKAPIMFATAEHFHGKLCTRLCRNASGMYTVNVHRADSIDWFSSVSQ